MAAKLETATPYTVQNPHRSNDPIVLLDPENLGVAVGHLLISYTVAEL